MIERLFGKPILFLYDDGGVFNVRARRSLLEEPQQDTLIKDSIKRVKEQLAQIPEGKTKALVVAVDWKFGVVPTARFGYAAKLNNGWEIHGEGFMSKTEKGASVRAVKTW